MFNNKFGVGILKHPGYNIDGGIGEAALMGALVGGGASLLTGKNPLTGALMGGLTGGALSGISGALANTGVNTAVENQIVTGAAENQVLPSLVQAGDPALADLGSFAKSPYGVDLAQGAAGVPPVEQGIGQLYNANAPSMMSNLATTNGYVVDPSYVGTTMPASQAYAAAPTATEAANAAATQTPAAAEAATKTAAETAAKSKGILGDVKDWYKTAPWYEKAGAGIAGSVALNKLFEDPTMVDPNIGKQTIDHPLANLSPDFKGLSVSPDVYKQNYAGYVRGPGYAEGGIAGLDPQSPMVAGMGNNTGYPQGMQDHTQYATPSQMPISSSVVNADYEQKTNPYTGEPVQMAEGGIARFATGGDTAGNQVYYDPTVGKYYTQSANAGGFAGLFTRPDNPFGMLFQAISGNNAMDGRTYLNGSPMGGFQSSEPQPNSEIYAPQYSSAAPVTSVPVASAPIATPAPSYSLADSLPLLQATNPGIAAMYAPKTEEVVKKAEGGIAGYSLGGYAAGGNPRLLQGPGDGISDSIPATIGGKQPARLADGEFVVPARIVSELGNGSTDAGARELYKMMERVQAGRKKSIGKNNVAADTKPTKHLPA